jgi:hypothetical protein
MGQFRFIKDKDPNNEYDYARVEVSFDAIDLSELLETFGDFLKGCGFGFKGEVGIIYDEPYVEVPSGKDPA